MSEMRTLGGRALAVRKDVGKTQKEMASFLGVATATWQKIERDEGVPSGETLLQFGKLGVNPGWVLSGLGPKSLEDNASPPPIQVDAKMVQEMHSTIERMAEVTLGRSSRQPQGFVEPPRPPTVRYYAVPASAGAGFSTIHEAPAQELDIDEFCDLAFHTSAKYITMHHVRGDSMFPTLPHGAVAVIDRRVRGEPDDGIVYLVSFDGDVLLKRIDYQEDGSIHLRSDNELPEYVPIRVPSDRKTELKIFGRLIGVVHTVK